MSITGGLEFESVTVSANGNRVVAVMQPTASSPPSGIVLSSNGGDTWKAAALPVGTYRWRGVDSSANGDVIVAVDHDGVIVRSIDAGDTWTQLTVTLTSGQVAPDTDWYRVKVSEDGNTIAIAANTFGGAPGTGIFVSRNGGTTWERGAGLPATADYTALAMSRNGMTIAASISNTAATVGRLVMSTDGGATFTELAMPAGATDTDWRAIAMSGNGGRLAAATGRFEFAPGTGQPGQLFTGPGNRTTLGTAGSITGDQNDTVTLSYADNGQWTVLPGSATGTFTIR